MLQRDLETQGPGWGASAFLDFMGEEGMIFESGDILFVGSVSRSRILL